VIWDRIKRRSRHPERGAIMVESAIVASAILVMVLGMVDFGLIGFLQISADAATFLDAHETVMLYTNETTTGSSTNPVNVTRTPFPMIAATSFAAPVITQPNPVPTVYIDYGYNDSSSPSPSRHGGAAMMMPYNERVNVVQQAFSFLNQQFLAKSSSTEPLWVEVGSHWDVSNVGYTQPYSTAPLYFNSNYFTQGDNTPYYYTGFNFMQYCPGVTMPWQTCSVGPNATTSYEALGVAEFATIQNNSFTATGAQGTIPVSGGVGVWPGDIGAATGIFYAAACHQRFYAQLAQFFVNAENGSGATDDGFYMQQTYNVCKNVNGNQGCNTGNHGSSVQTFSQTGGSPTGFFTGGSGSPSSATANTDIATIYGWDFYPSGNAPSNNQGSNGPDPNYIVNITQPYEGCTNAGFP